VGRVVATILDENQGMLKLAKRFHFVLSRGDDPSAISAVLELEGRTAGS
jgi:hypothetical protein